MAVSLRYEFYLTVSDNRAVQSGGYIPNPNGTPTATAQFTNNRWTNASFDAAGDETTGPGSTSETFGYDGEYRAHTANANSSVNRFE